MEELERTGQELPRVMDDIFCSKNYIHHVQRGDIQRNDMVLMLQVDGAQLYAHKDLDTWILIWVILDLPPDMHYKKRFVIPAAVIPGPNKPKNLDSFLFVSLHHLSAIQKDGLRVWDAHTNREFTTRLWLQVGGADGPGSAQITGFVTHNGLRGCRRHCPVRGMHMPGKSMYYPVLMKPLNYVGDEPDTIPESVNVCTPEEYYNEVSFLLVSSGDTDYKNRRKITGLVKPSLISGLPQAVPIPYCFPGDLMHLGSLNLTDLFLGLWRGTLDCNGNDDQLTWDWAILKGDTWTNYGKEVANATPYLPGFFGKAPRNIAEKGNSRFKAIEFEIWFYQYGPAMLYGILPDKYWRHYCKLVTIMRMVHLRSVTMTQVLSLNRLVLSYYKEFESFYYARDPERIHFVRQGVHALLHLPPEILQAGPPVYYSQWTMERTIGNLGEEIRQPSNPFANLSRRAILHAQMNSLAAVCPSLYLSQAKIPMLPRGAEKLKGGFALLRAGETIFRKVPQLMKDSDKIIDEDSCRVITDFWRLYQHPGRQQSFPKIACWSRLKLPNDQIARSLWKEANRPLERIRMARNVKVSLRLIHGLFYAE